MVYWTQEARITTEQNKQKGHSRRYREIATILVRHRLAKTIKTLGMEDYLPLHWMPPNFPWTKNEYTEPEHVRMALASLGATFIKIGQIISTRVDLVPPEFILELAKLQSSVTALPAEAIKKRIGEELGRPVEAVYASFDPVPIGVASIGQAHAATLQDGTEVIVKVRKPGVADQVDEDMEILHNLAVNAAKHLEGTQQYDIVGIVQETADTLKAEMDYLLEAHCAEHFAEFFRDDPTIHIPKIFWEFTTPRVITMERIHGINVQNKDALDKAGFDRKLLAIRCVNIWLRMVFEDASFHADPHPGNLFVEADGRIALIDFGMVGIVDDKMRQNLGIAFKAMMDRDPEALADALMDLGAVPPTGARAEYRLGAELKRFMKLYPTLTMEEMKGRFKLEDMFTVMRNNHLQLPSNTFLLLKTMVMAEGIGEGLDPDFKIIPVVEPHIKRLIEKKFSPAAITKIMPSAAMDLAIFGMELPKRLSKLVRAAERGDVLIRTDVTGLDQHVRKLEQLVNRLVLGGIASAFLIGLAILVSAYRPAEGVWWVGTMIAIGFVSASLMGTFLVWGIVTSKKR